jgi:hypothetical protein
MVRTRRHQPPPRPSPILGEGDSFGGRCVGLLLKLSRREWVAAGNAQPPPVPKGQLAAVLDR